MDADAQIAPVAALLADETRASMVWALCGGRALPACDLAIHGGVTASTTSAHLAKLVEGGLLSIEKQGRHRYYRLASPEVVRLLEALAAVARPAPARSPADGRRGQAIRFARSCYDHLAGRLGVAVTEALVRKGGLARRGDAFVLTGTGERLFRRLGVDVAAARGNRRAFARPCLDWSERRHHLAGSLGAALLARLMALRWLLRGEESRALHLTPRGREALASRLRVTLEG